MTETTPMPTLSKSWLESWIRYAEGCRRNTASMEKDKSGHAYADGFHNGLASATNDMLDAFLTFTSRANRKKAASILREMRGDQ